MKRQLNVESHLPNKKFSTNTGIRREISTVLVNNLPKSYNSSKVHKLFGDCGVINHVDVTESLDKTCRLARVEFQTYDEALTALTKTLKKVGQNEMIVTLLQGCTIWLTNFPPSYTQRNLKDLINSNGAVALSIRFPSLRFNSNRRFAYVDVTSPEEAEDVVKKLNGINIDGLGLVAKKSDPIEKDKRSDYGASERREVIVRQLNKNQLNEQYLRQHFSELGVVESVTIPIKQDHKSGTGYAFVTFTERKAAKDALNITTLGSKEVKINLADRKAYTERQKLKKIMQSESRNDKIVAIFPLKDKTSKAQLKELLLEKAQLAEDDIEDIFLVPDRQAALIIFTNTKQAARCSMSLHGCDFQRIILHCGSVYDLRKRKSTATNETARSKSAGAFLPTSGLDTGKATSKLNNADFREMFLGKK